MSRSNLPRLSLLALAVSGLSFQAHAANFEMGDFRLQVDSKISVGSSWRAEERNDDYISKGTLQAQGTSSPALTDTSYQGSQTNNTDDGNMNFDQGDAISQVVTGSHELSLKHDQWRNMGANLSFRYWYDHALNEQSGSPNNADMVDDWEDTTAYDDAQSGVELMNAYVWGEFDVANRPAQVVLGRHVLNWGESTFIQGGQNVANPVDVPALRRPGAAIRDALLPVNMLSGSLALDEMGNFTLEGYYQLEWERTRADACGTFFSNNDFGAEGCGPVYLQSSKTEEANTNEAVVGVAPRTSDNEPDAEGQFGLALKWYAEQLNGTEFGAYFQNVHSRLPYAGGVVSEGVVPAALEQVLTQLNVDGDDPTQYRVEFPEDQKVMGLSFATLLPSGTAWSGEFTYRPDSPIQINANDVLVRGAVGNLAALKQGDDNLEAAANQAGTTKELYLQGAGLSAQEATAVVNNLETAAGQYDTYSGLMPSEIAALSAGDQAGYREFDVYQFQSTFIHDINRVLAADNLRLIGEVGFTYVNDLPDTSEMRFGRSSVYGSYGKEATINDAADLAKLQSDDYKFADNGYVTEFSWGYRLLAQLEYNNALVGGLKLKPSLSWSHDVSGYGPEPGSQFYEGRMIMGTALGAEYMNTYFGNLSYTSYFDTDYWDLDDRDFVSLSVGMNY
ncbi:DUF1302 domain-containing protein [Marinospirillum sp.]|uniref:DUF1302 domain-containing protein n=1 Tax=Marinospirillum sp. TaxID=2183934 RepID=UPI0028702781|nr:DUF1302 domain-containing protein [Marinospirillum sp.]MDR9466852.1 DUF1302 domain-containing protein [Marinospirillum sp.]